MIIFLYGQDNYRARQKLNEIIAQYKETHKSGLNLKHLEGKNFDFQDFKNEFQITPMFKEKKLVILSDAFDNLDFKDGFLKKAERFIEDKDVTLLFYEEKEISVKDSLFEFLVKKAKCQEFKALPSPQLRSWLKKEFEKYGAEINPETSKVLVDFVGNDLWQLSNEVQKLTAFKKGKKVKPKDVVLLVRQKNETDIFKTIDALALRNKRQALDLLHKHLEKGDSPLYLLRMINFQFRNLLMVKNLTEEHETYQAILRKTRLHPYVVKKSLWQADRFNSEELKKIYQKIFQVDLSIKTGKIEPQTGLELLVTEI